MAQDAYKLLLSTPHYGRFDQNLRNRMHRHTFFEPCLVVSGSGQFLYRNHRHRLRPGELFLAEPGIYHEIVSSPTDPLEIVFTQFMITESPDYQSDDSVEQQVIGDFVNGHDVFRRDQFHLSIYFDCLFHLVKVEGDPYREFFINELMRPLILQMMAALTTEKRPATVFEDSAQEPDLDRAIAFIENRLTEPISVPDIANAGCMSERTLRRIFRQRLNRTVIQEIQYRKMRRAAALLAIRELKVAEVARRVGIHDPAQFSRLFRQTMGVTPRQFRLARHAAPGWFRDSQLMMETEFLEGSNPGD